MYGRGKSKRFRLLLALFSVVVLAMPIAVSCEDEEDTSSEGTPAATETDILIDPIKLDAGYVSGTTIGEPGKEVRIYRGVPYAAPPVGDLRWKPPQPVEPWSGIRECTQFSASAAQLEWALGEAGPKSEDSLYLNVLTPAKKTGERLPVLVWFHGGGYSYGSGNGPLYVWPSLSQHGAVVVSVNHRLAAIGLLALPALSAESPNGVSGNYMFLDLIAALEWVQTNIAAFGGDPNNVTIFGESGGGAKADALLTSPVAKGLFHRAISQSGANMERPGGRRMLTLAEAEALGEQLVAKLGVRADDLAALRAVPAAKIIDASLALAEEMGTAGSGYTGAVDRLVVDGWFMADTPENIFAQDKQNNVPILLCANLGELIAENTLLSWPELVGAYVKRLESAHRLGTNGYAAIFTQVPSNWKEDGVLANHVLELPYVFGFLEALKSPIFQTFERLSGAVQQDPGLTEDDEKVAEAMMTMWVQFAKTGDPSVEGLIDWPTWDATNDQYLDIGWPLQVKPGYSKIVPEE